MRQSRRQSPGSCPHEAGVRSFAELPPPDSHIFHDRRVADIADSVPKHSGYWASQAHVTRSILAGLFGRKRA
jgi:hypothetical protein